MATFSAIIDSETDPDAPLTSQLGKRWDNNCIAIAEGAAGAPRIVAGALSLAQGTTSGTLSPGDQVNITMDRYSFFPVVTSAGSVADIKLLNMSGNSISGTSSRFSLSLGSTAAANVTYTVTWDYIQT